jgi:hypothetical protein
MNLEDAGLCQSTVDGNPSSLSQEIRSGSSVLHALVGLDESKRFVHDGLLRLID